jgi:hypothetical protein
MLSPTRFVRYYMETRGPSGTLYDNSLQYCTYSPNIENDTHSKQSMKITMSRPYYMNWFFKSIKQQKKPKKNVHEKTGMDLKFRRSFKFDLLHDY